MKVILSDKIDVIELIVINRLNQKFSNFEFQSLVEEVEKENTWKYEFKKDGQRLSFYINIIDSNFVNFYATEEKAKEIVDQLISEFNFSETNTYQQYYKLKDKKFKDYNREIFLATIRGFCENISKNVEEIYSEINEIRQKIINNSSASNGIIHKIGELTVTYYPTNGTIAIQSKNPGVVKQFFEKLALYIDNKDMENYLYTDDIAEYIKNKYPVSYNMLPVEIWHYFIPYFRRKIDNNYSLNVNLQDAYRGLEAYIAFLLFEELKCEFDTKRKDKYFISPYFRSNYGKLKDEENPLVRIIKDVYKYFTEDKIRNKISHGNYIAVPNKYNTIEKIHYIDAILNKIESSAIELKNI